jgi:hypothetical protein
MAKKKKIPALAPFPGRVVRGEDGQTYLETRKTAGKPFRFPVPATETATGWRIDFTAAMLRKLARALEEYVRDAEKAAPGN